MNYKTQDIERIARQLSTSIEYDIHRAGIFYRIFYRCKTANSLSKKSASVNEEGLPKYNTTDKFIRDTIGIRINLYFVEDLEILTAFFKEKYKQSYLEDVIDKNKTTEFKPTRINLVFKLPNEFIDEFKEVVKDRRVDCSFELQLRTVLSEGWHEVEHDLRYKCPEDWVNYPELSRTFNGILASLETNEWCIVQLFERLAYSHYKKGDESAMLRSKLRIRFEDFSISKPLLDNFKSNSKLFKEFYKLDRTKIVSFLLKNKVTIPFTLENIILLINFSFIKNVELIKLTSPILIEEFGRMK